MSKLEFWFDFGSPNSYFAHKVLPELEKRLDIEFARRPALLGGIFKATGNQSPFFAFAGIPAKMDYTRHEMIRFVRHHGLHDFKMNPHFPVNTLTAMRGAVAAEMAGELAAYMDCVMKAMWEEECKADDPAVLLQAIAASGLDDGYYQDKVAAPEVKADLMATTQEAIDRGVFGMPTFFVGEEMFFGKDSLAAVEREIMLSHSAGGDIL